MVNDVNEETPFEMLSYAECQYNSLLEQIKSLPLPNVMIRSMIEKLETYALAMEREYNELEMQLEMQLDDAFNLGEAMTKAVKATINPVETVAISGDVVETSCAFYSEGIPTCNSISPNTDHGYACTRAMGHTGDHMACGIKHEDHPIKTWENK